MVWLQIYCMRQGKEIENCCCVYACEYCITLSATNPSTITTQSNKPKYKVVLHSIYIYICVCVK